MKILHSGGFNLEACREYKPLIVYNAIDSLTRIVRAPGRAQDRLPQPRPLLTPCSCCAHGPGREQGEITPELLGVMRRLWARPRRAGLLRPLQRVPPGGQRGVLPENDLEASPRWLVPTVEDILRSRDMTTGIVENKFTFKAPPSRWWTWAASGRRKRKWIHCFEGVTAIIFCVELSGYDLKLYEDSQAGGVRRAPPRLRAPAGRAGPLHEAGGPPPREDRGVAPAARTSAQSAARGSHSHSRTPGPLLTQVTTIPAAPGRGDCPGPCPQGASGARCPGACTLVLCASHTPCLLFSGAVGQLGLPQPSEPVDLPGQEEKGWHPKGFACG